MTASDQTLSSRLELPLDKSVSSLVVGLSGGLDSCALLHALVHSDIAAVHPLRAIHINHGLHPDADGWMEHCADFCASLSVPLTIVRVVVDRQHSAGIEAAARHARYHAFTNKLASEEVLVLGHHRNDQAETFLLRALRASGTDGLGSMREWRLHERNWIWRPFLNAAASELSAYAMAHGLRWMEDPSNTDTNYDRNFLRQCIFPALRTHWPQADRAFAQSAWLHAQSTDLLEREDRSLLASVRTIDAAVLNITALQTLTIARRARVLRRWIADLKLPPLPTAGIERIESDLLHCDADATPEFVWSNGIVQRWRGLLRASLYRAPIGAFETTWDGKTTLQLPHRGALKLLSSNSQLNSNISHTDTGFDHPWFDQPLIVRTRQGGERIRLPQRSHSHALKHVLQQLGIPIWERAELPLLTTHHGEVLAAGDLVYSAGFDTWLRSYGYRLQWTRDLTQSMA